MIDWPAFFVVLVATLVAACLVVTLYSLGLRLVDRTPGGGDSRCCTACTSSSPISTASPRRPGYGTNVSLPARIIRQSKEIDR